MAWHLDRAGWQPRSTFAAVGAVIPDACALKIFGKPAPPKSTIVAAMDEREARLRLLEDELGALHAGISAHDGWIAQTKGWCITIVAGLLALDITQHRQALSMAAAVVSLAFWLADAHTASIQRVMILRQQQIEHHFKGRPALDSLDDVGLAIPGMASSFLDPPQVQGWFGQVRFEVRLALHEAVSPYRMFFYVVLLIAIALTASIASFL